MIREEIVSSQNLVQVYLAFKCKKKVGPSHGIETGMDTWSARLRKDWVRFNASPVKGWVKSKKKVGPAREIERGLGHRLLICAIGDSVRFN